MGGFAKSFLIYKRSPVIVPNSTFLSSESLEDVGVTLFATHGCRPPQPADGAIPTAVRQYEFVPKPIPP